MYKKKTAKRTFWNFLVVFFIFLPILSLPQHTARVSKGNLILENNTFFFIFFFKFGIIVFWFRMLADACVAPFFLLGAGGR
jgi:hypothetical protein